MTNITTIKDFKDKQQKEALDIVDRYEIDIFCTLRVMLEKNRNLYQPGQEAIADMFFERILANFAGQHLDTIVDDENSTVIISGDVFRLEEQEGDFPES